MRRFPSREPWLWAPLVFLADLASKRLVLANADVLRRKVEILGDFFRLAYVRNPGAAMGLFHGGRPFLIAVSAVASIVLLMLYRRTPAELRLRRGALAVILGGALVNLVYRFFYCGFVVDFEVDRGEGACASCVLRPDGVAVHGGPVEAGEVHGRAHILREDSAKGPDQMDCFRPVHGPAPFMKGFQGLGPL